MRKSTRIFKKYIATFLIVLMSINSFGAVVSDNDGSAFITKAEFDSLKNNFQSQIDQYNTSIDSKIDGAIASYLAGINVSKTLVLKNLINNISDIKWVNNFYIYGTWKKWTSNSTSTQNLTKSWFVPSGAEERAHVRGTGQMIWDTSSYAWSYYIMSIYASAETGQYTNILPYNDGRSYYDEIVPVFGLNMVEENNMWLLSNTNPITNMSAFQAYHPGNEQNWGVGTDAHLWRVGQYMAVVDSVDFNVAKKSGDFIAYSVSGHSTRPTPDTFNWTSHLTSERANEPVVFQGWAIKDGSSLSLSIPSRTNAVTGHALNYLKDNTYFLKGCTWHSVANDDITNLGRCINYYMLGNDNNDKYNLFKFTNEYFGEGIRIDVSGTDTSKTFSCPVDIESWTFTQLPYGGSREDGIKRTELTTPIPFTIDYPNYPQASLSEIPTRHFEYNGNKLKMGQGIPLVIDNVAGNGYIHLTFDADDMELISNTHKSYKFNIDIKKSDFLQSNKTDYVDVYEGLVDPSSTTKTLKKCKRLSYDATTDGGKVELTVPIKNEESLWFRIAPENTSTGRYCKTENLNIKLMIE